LIGNGKGEFDQDVFVLGNNFKIQYEQLLEAYKVANVSWFWSRMWQ
jgi:hypothetical protein